MAGYTRQSTFADGDTITAALFNNEFNQLLNAFGNTSGHKHDGTANEGPVIGLIGDAGETSPNNKVLIDTTNNYIEFYVEVSSAPVQQLYIADGAIIPVTDSDIDLGTTSLRFKDTYTDTVTTTGNVSIGGDLTVTGSATISGNLTFGDADTDSINLAAEIDSDIIPNTDGTYDLGSATKEWQDLYIDGTANIDSLVADTADINGGTIDGVTIGGTTAGAVTFTDLSDGTITIAGFADEDNMVSDSATLLPTQQSVKAYVDSQVTAQDLDFQGDSGGALSIDLDSETLTIAGGTGIDTTGATNTLTVAIDSTVTTLTGTQTLTNKTLTSPDINTPDIDGGTIDATTIGGATPAAGSFTTLSSSGGITGTLQTAAQTNITSVGTLSSLSVGSTLTIDNTASSSFGTIEISGTSGAYIDLKSPSSDDFDLRIITSGTGGQINAAAGTLALQIAGSTVLSTASGGVAVTGTLSATGNITGTLATAAQPNITSLGTLTGLTTTGDINFGDNDKAVFGAGSDLQISHTGAASLISDTGTGDLFIRASNALRLQSADNENYLVANANGSLNLYYDNTQKFATTSTGIDVTGTVTADGLTVDTSTLVVDATNNRVGIGTASPAESLHTTGNIRFGDSAPAELYTNSSELRLGVDRNNDNTTSNITFYTNNDEKVRIDADGNVGIGETSPSTKLHITSAAPNIRLEDSDTNSYGEIVYNTAGGGLLIRSDENAATGASGSNILFETDGSERVRIDSSGNLLVGKTSAALAGAGTAILSTGTHNVTVDGDTALQLNRLTSDGNLITFYKDTSTVGSIGTVSGYLYVGGTAGNDAFLSFGADGVRPATSAGAARDAAIDLGGSSNRFKDLHLSGGAYTNGITTTGNLVIGTEDNNSALLEISGAAAGSTEGGEIRLDTAADHDGTYEFYRIDVNQDDFRIGRQGNTDFYIFQDGKVKVENVFEVGGVSNLSSVDASAGISSTALMNVKADGTNDTVINVGLNTASNHYAYIDLIGDSTYTDYGLRIIRNNGGANTSSGIHHRGTGELFFRTDDAAAMKFETNASEAMRIDSLGDVGIGTQNPTHKLHVQGTSNDTIDETKGTMKVQASGGNGMILGTIASSPYTSYIQSAYVQDTSVAQYNLALNPIGGNVGIGTSSPSDKFHVKGTGSTGIVTERSGTSSAALIADSSGTALYSQESYGSTTAVPFRIYTGTSERMRIDGSGNVGIGQTPTNRFDVNSGTNIVVSKFQSSLGGAGNRAIIQLGASGNSQSGLQFIQCGSSSSIEGGANAATIENTENAPLIFGTNNTEKMRIDSSGNLLVGTATHRNYSGGTTEITLGTDSAGSTTGGAITFASGNGLLGYLGGQESSTTLGTYTATHLQFNTNNTERMRINSSGRLLIGGTADRGAHVCVGGDSNTARVIPMTDNVGYVGEAAFRWQAIYAVNGSIQTSDEREKTEIKKTTLGLDFIKDLKPVSYKWIDGKQQNKGKDEREHQGLIAQQVAETVEKHGIDKNNFGGLDIQKTEKYDDFHGMSYDQFVAPLIKAIQEQQAQIEALQSEINELKNS